MDKKPIVITGAAIALAIGVFITVVIAAEHPPALDTPVVTSATSTNPQASYECNQDAKTCPDGSTVGRTGPDCEFTACPPTSAKSATVKTTMGQAMTGLNVTITPFEIISDSRCAEGVQCIWAGTVQLKAKIKSAMGESTMTFELGKPVTTEAEEITLTDVSPGKVAGQEIPVSSYRFTFEIKMR